MKAKVIATREKGKTTVNNQPVKVGDVVEVSECTLRNLVKKGILEPVDGDAKKVDLEKPSVLTDVEAEAQIEKATEEREAKKRADEEKKKAQNK
jgi:hypothetical protein